MSESFDEQQQESDKTQVKPNHVSFTGLVATAAALTIFLTLLSFGARLHYGLELLCHWRVHYAIALLAAAIYFILARRWRWFAFTALFAVINLCTIAPLYFGTERTFDTPPPDTLRITSCNVNTGNKEHALALATLQELDADLILLMEVNDAWLRDLAPLRESHPYHTESPRNDNFGIALYSKYPLKDLELFELGDAGVPSVRATTYTYVPYSTITIYGVHTLPPIGKRYADIRNTQLRDLAKQLHQNEGPVIMVGDLNTTAWSPVFKDLVRDSGLRDSTRGYGIQPTWPAEAPLLYIPIDHALYSQDLEVVSRRTGPKTGSDHLPLTLDFALPIITKLVP